MEKQIVNKIEMYLSGELNQRETKAFQDEINSDPGLAKEVQLRKEVNEVIIREDIRNLRSLLSKIHRDHNRKSEAKIIRFISDNKFAIASTAASLLILVLIGSMFIFNGNQNLNNDQLFNNYYQEDDAVMISRSSTTSGKELQIKDALLAYQGKDYETAIEIFKNQENNTLAKYYLGLSYLETGKTKKSIEIFNSLIENKDNLFVEQAEWYLGLCYLKTNQKEMAKELFEKISNSNNNIYNTKAKEVLRNM